MFVYIESFVCNENSIETLTFRTPGCGAAAQVAEAEAASFGEQTDDEEETPRLPQETRR